MKKTIFWAALAIQTVLFYGLPMLAGPTDAMGVVLLLLLGTLGLSFAVGCSAAGNMRFLYPAATAILFLPSVWMYYNDSALIHALWYLVDAVLGIGTGALLRGVGRWIARGKKS